MAELLTVQRGRAKGTITRISNFIPSINSDTTVDAIKLQLEKLKEAWSEFKSYDDQLTCFEKPSEFELIEPRYDQTILALTQAIKNHSNFESATPPLRAQSAKIPSHKATLTRLKGSITRIHDFTTTIDETTELATLQTKLDMLDASWRDLQYHIDQLGICGDSSESDVFVEFENKYLSAKAKLRTGIKSLSPDQQTSSSLTFDLTTNLNSTMTRLESHQQTFFQELWDKGVLSNEHRDVKLPPMNVPNFYGNYSEWPSFSDIFTSSIHSKKSLSNVHKFQYLKSFLKGDAAALVRHITITDENYQQAWNKLCARYDKKKQTISAFIKQFLELPQVSASNPTSIRSLNDKSDEIMRGLDALGFYAQSRHPWLIFIILSKLDSESKQLWSQRTSEDESIKFETMQSFLNWRCDALEESDVFNHPKTNAKSIQPTKSSPTSSTKCPKCTGDHFIYKCPKFKLLDISSRRKLVNQLGLCFNCLASGHQTAKCPSKFSCHHCREKHHSSLHFEQLSSHLSTTSNEVSHSNNEPAKKLNPAANSFVSSINNPQQSTKATINTPSLQSTPQPSTSQKTVHQATIQHSTHASSFNQPENQHTINNQCTSQNSSNHTGLNSVTSRDFTSLSSSGTATHTLLPTCIVQIKDANGIFHKCRALLDSGSQVSLVSDSFIQRLNLKRERAKYIVNGLASTTIAETLGKVELQLFSHTSPTKSLVITALILEKLTSPIPSTNFDIKDWNHIKNVQLADPEFNKTNAIDLLIGIDYFFDVICYGKINSEEGQPILQNTIFGWTVAGQIGKRNQSIQEQITINNCHASIDHEINQTLRLFWELENVSENAKPKITLEEQCCETHFAENYTVTATGNYQVRLPFRESTQTLGNSLRMAVSRLHSMERRFAKDHTLRKEYHRFMSEYLRLGHMELIPSPSNVPDAYYLPHHCVFKPSSSTTKLRVVFDGSAKTTSGASLNTILAVGPNIQRDIFSILVNFRLYRIAISADIEKMYRQVSLAPEDRDYQRIVWRFDETQPIQHFRLTTVTYGTSSAAFLATRALVQAALDCESQHPEIAKIIRQNFYIDDLLTGADTVEEAMTITQQLSQILNSKGFPLRKWNTNSHYLLNHLSQAETNRTSVDLSEHDHIEKVLGLCWSSETDVFSFKTSIDSSRTPTKRNLLSQSSRIFDPLGFLSPCTITIKIMFQQLWLEKLQWDDEIPERQARKWKAFTEQFNKFGSINVPRWLHTSATDNTWQLHAFCDASEAAYAAVVYCRVIINGIPHVNIVAAKTRVAPLRQESLPRLELCGALLLSRLLRTIKSSLESPDVPIFAWTDSKIVLAWLSSEARRWKTFIANRTPKILEVIPVSNWRYVPTADNPADVASRGTTPHGLHSHNLWWHGPSWLNKDEHAWPTCPPCNSDTSIEEEKLNIQANLSAIDNDTLTDLFTQISSLEKLFRIIIQCKRWLRKARHRKTPEDHGLICPEHLTREEWQDALHTCIRWAQVSEFQEEFRHLQRRQQLSKNNTLLALSPFIDSNNLLRVGGRLQHAEVSYQAKHPFILPKKHILSDRLIEHFHQKHFHAGPTLLLHIIRQKFWIIGCRSKIRIFVRRCITCFRQKCKGNQQYMANLPSTRVTISRPFAYCGVDYAGPLRVRINTLRNSKIVKGYIALFVCFTTKAVHIEFVSDLSSEAFIAAMRRFTSRRGIPSTMYSDNATNFVGAKRKLSELHSIAAKASNCKLISNFIAEQNIHWSFIPPSAPHFGGLWEANIKSTKGLMKRAIGDQALTFEEYATLLTQIEGTLNSRPLTQTSEDPDSLDVLTPAHFLVGQPLTALPDTDHMTTSISTLKRWQMVQQILQSFWRRWTKEYLTDLQQRSKWRTSAQNIKIDDIVVILEDNLPPAAWALGRVIATHPGPDGLVRAVTLRTAAGNFKRPIVKLARLPLD